MTLTFNRMCAMVMTHIHTQTQVQRSVGLKDTVEKTDGQTDDRLPLSMASHLIRPNCERFFSLLYSFALRGSAYVIAHGCKCSGMTLKRR